jgi:hypothetical protein
MGIFCSRYGTFFIFTPIVIKDIFPFFFRIDKTTDICVSTYLFIFTFPPTVGAVRTKKVYSPLKKLFMYAVQKPSEINTLSPTQKRANCNIVGVFEYFLLLFFPYKL